MLRDFHNFLFRLLLSFTLHDGSIFFFVLLSFSVESTFDDINSNSSCKLSRFDGLLFVCLSCNFAMSNVCEKTKMDC